MSEHQSPKTVVDDRPDVRQPMVMLSDLSGDLLWTRILRAPALALAPSRLMMGSLCVFLMALVVQLAGILTSGDGVLSSDSSKIQSLSDRFNVVFTSIEESASTLDPLGLISSIGMGADAIASSVLQFPLVSLSLGIPLIAILCFAGGAIARSSAIEFAHGRVGSSDDTVGFALSRIRSLVTAIVAPVLFSAVIYLLIALGGLLLSVPVLDVVGSLLYGLGLVLGLVATVVLMLHVLALPLIIPALSVEGTDSFDAIQRSYAYVIARPLRYVLYGVILLLLGVIATSVFTMVGRGAISMSDWAAQFLANRATTRALTGEGDLEATKSTAHAIIQIWRAVFELVIAGYAISLFFTSSTLLYLVVRRVCDGQDIHEVWDGLGE